MTSFLPNGFDEICKFKRLEHLIEELNPSTPRYTSPTLAQELVERDTQLCGTVREKTEGLPLIFRHAHKGLTAQNRPRKKGVPLKRGQVIFRRNKEMLAIKFEDRKTVRFLTTIHRAESAHLAKGYRKVKGTGKTVFEDRLKPLAVLDYNKFMNAVDRTGQLAGNTKISRKSRSWKHKITIHIFIAIITNAYILHRLQNKGTKDELSHSMFCLILAQQLVKRGRTELSEVANILGSGNTERERRELARDAETTRLIGRDHWPAPTPGSAHRLRLPKRCVACKEDGKDAKVRKTTVMCRKCNVPLCTFPCFEAFHTKNNYLDAIKRVRAGNPPDARD